MMREDLKFPRIDAIDSVLIKIGVDPSTRYNKHAQDHEYTTCKIDELEQYINLYEKKDTSIYEKRVLGCYFLECLNEYFQYNDIGHPMKNRAFELLHSDIEIHESELKYWTDVFDPNEENWWPITKEIINWRNT